MKLKLGYFFSVLVILAVGSVAHAATITWANTNGGDWNVATNWSPNQVPESGDDVIITNSGNYVVTNAPSVTLDNLILGGTNGAQTLTISSLTLTNIGIVNSNGVLNWGGGDLEGALTVAQGGTLSISNTVYFDEASPYNNNAALTNYGTVILAGNITSYANEGSLGGSATIDNAGLWESVADNAIQYVATGTNFFINAGTLEKIGGTGTSTINWNFASTGTINTPSGTFALNWGGPSVLNGNLVLAGTIAAPLTVASNAVLNLSGDDLESSLTVLQGGTLTISNTVYFDEASPYNNNAALTNYGTVILAGTIYSYANEGSLGGSATIDNAGLWESVADNAIQYVATGTNLFINTGTLEKIGGTGTSTINWNFDNEGGTVNTPTGSFSMGNWVGSGLVYGNATLSGGTIAGTLVPGAVMNFSATVNGSLTISSNAIANWSGGDIEGSLTISPGGTLSISNTVYFDEASPYNNNAALTNYGTVILAGNITSYANEGSLGGSATIDNAGLWESVADNAIQYVATGTNLFINTGTLEKIGGTGTSTINWNSASTGTINTPSGTFALNWGAPSTVNGNLSLAGSSITFPLTVASNAVLNLSGNDLESSLTVLQGGTLTISNTVYFDEASPYNNNAALTNYGTVILAGTIYSYANEGSLGGLATIDNAGLWESVADNAIQYVATSTNFFINAGTLEKIGGTGTSTINWNFDNEGGTVNTPTGSFSMGNWVGSGLVHGNANVSGSIGGIVASNAVLNWVGGDLEGALTVAHGGTLSISNTVYFDEASPYNHNAALTNYGTVIWAATIYSFANEGSLGGSATIDNAGLWESVADNAIQYATTSTNLFINTGTLEKIGGTGTSTINWDLLNNGGILGSQTNTLSLAGDYDLTGGTLNFGISSLTGYGIIDLSGSPATLTGTLSANFNSGFLPAVNDSWQIINSTSLSGVFTQTNLPPVAVWQVTTNSTSLTITVLKLVPQITWPAPAGIVYGTALSATQLDATANWNGSAVPGSFIYSPPLGTVLQSGGNQTLSMTFLPGDTTTYTNVTTNVTINVLKAPLGVTASNRSKTYGQNLTFAGTEFVPSGLVNGDTVTSAGLASAGAISNAPVSGSPYSITITNAMGDVGLTNYSITYTYGQLTVNKASLGITASSRGKTYGQNIAFVGTEFTPSGLQNSETIGTVTLTSAGAVSNAPVSGSPYNIVPSAATGGTFSAGNYAITYTDGTLTVNRAGLTVTANNAARTYGAANQSFSATYSGFVNNETVSVVNGMPNFSTPATVTSPVGGYTITPSLGTLSANNYSFGPFNNGTLTINSAALSITASNLSKTYGQNLTFAGTEFAASGLLNSDTATHATLTSSGAISNAPVSGSPYSIVPSAVTGSGLTNYSITYSNGLLTVNKAALGITANNKNKTYGQNIIFAGTEFVSSPLQNSETIGTVTLTSAGAISNAPVSGSPYSIVPSAATGGTFTPGNYTTSYTNGALTVNQAALTITANSTNKIAGETWTFAGTEFTASGLQNLETVGTVSLMSAGTPSSAPAGPYNIVPSAPVGGTFAQGNYSDIFVNGTLTVLGPPELTLTSLGNQYVVAFPSVSGQMYQLQSRTNLTLGNWSSLGGSINGTGGTVKVTNAITVPQSFFQLQVMP